MNVLVTGGTGTLGRHVVRLLRNSAESWLKARKLNKRLINLPLPLKLSRQVAEGRLLCPDHKDGKITFEQYLADKYPV